MDYNFKSVLIYYNVLQNINKKMSLMIYKDQILKLVIKLWLSESQDFLLKENNDSRNKKAQNQNTV